MNKIEFIKYENRKYVNRKDSVVSPSYLNLLVHINDPFLHTEIVRGYRNGGRPERG